jgi:hypothetical protein
VRRGELHDNLVLEDKLEPQQGASLPCIRDVGIFRLGILLSTAQAYIGIPSPPEPPFLSLHGMVDGIYCWPCRECRQSTYILAVLRLRESSMLTCHYILN